MKYILKIYKSIFKWAPISATLTLVDYLYGAFVPAIVALISARLFDSAANVLAGEPQKETFIFYTVMYIVVYLINDLLYFLRGITLNAGVYEKGTAHFRIALYEKLAKLPLISFEDTNILNMKERAERAVNDEKLPEIFNHTARFARAVIMVISIAVVLSQYSLWLLPLSLVSVVPYLFARIIRGKEFFYVKYHQAKKTRLLSYLWSLFTTRQTAKEMRVMGFDGYITDKWHETRDEVNEELWAVQKKDALSLLLCDGFRIIGYGASLVIVLFLVVDKQVSVGVFGAAITAFMGMQEGMKSFLQLLGNFNEQIAYAKDYYSFFDMQEEKDGDKEYDGLKDKIVLKDVSFKYPNSEKYALDSVNLEIKKGEKIAVLGENGSGKTTLSKVLLGLYPAGSGKVFYDDYEIDLLKKDDFYADISAIAQDFVSYSLKVRENIAISDISKLNDDSAIGAVLKESGVSEDIADIKNLDEMMGREFEGKEISGGQWQKLAIARGLFKKSCIIVLDEPTSALDPLIEAEILTKFLDASKDKTSLIISHRVGLCKLVDRIIVMKDGTVAEIGTHSELISLGCEYSKLYTEQAKWY